MWICFRKTALAAVLLALAAPVPRAENGLPAVPRENFKNRRAALAEKLGEAGAVVLFARAEMRESGDSPLDNDFYYFTGVEEPEAVLLLALSGGGKFSETLFLPAWDAGWERWNGPRPSAREDAEANKKLAAEFGVELIAPVEKFDEALARSFRRGTPRLWTLWDSVPADQPLNARLAWLRDLRDRNPGLEVKSLAEARTALRLVKDEAEIAMLREAMETTAAGYRAALMELKPGVMEYELQAAMEGAYRRRGQEKAFPSIVASGPSATVLHYTKNTRKTGRGELVLFDVGARAGHYCADISRTFPADGKFTARQREIYTLVWEAQRRGIAAVKPGATIMDVDKAARDYLKEKGFDFPHGTSHYVGLDVHDVGGRDVPLQPGMVLTVEPGIYLDEEQIGVRIEDTVLVTEDGCEVLSRHIPSAPDEVEKFLKDLRRKGGGR